MGFDAKIDDANIDEYDIYSETIPDDLVKFGIIPELVGRMPVVTSLHHLDVDALIEILTKPKNAITKQYKKLFEMEEVKLDISIDALKEIAEIAIKRNTGARGLRAIMESFMLQIMYSIPEMKNLKECLITSDVVQKKDTPVYVFDNNDKISA